MAAIEIFQRPVPRRSIVGFVGPDPEAISRALRVAGDLHAEDVPAGAGGRRDDLLVDYALDLIDPLSRMRSRRDLIAARRRGATVLIASYREELLLELCDEIWWIERDAVRAQGDPADVLRQWHAHTIKLWHREQKDAAPPMQPALTAGDGRAQVLSVELLDHSGVPVGGWLSGEAAVIRVGIRFVEPVADPVAGILIRTRIGLNVYGTNTELERLQLGPRAAGDTLRLVFRFRCDLCPGEYTLTVASHDPDGVWHEWLDDVVAFTVADVRYTAGVANLRAAVEWSVSDT